jgi:hypothetical protein
MPEDDEQAGERGQEHRNAIDETDRDIATDGDQSVSSCRPRRIRSEGVPLSVNVMGVSDGGMLNERTDVDFRWGGQIVTPRGGLDLLPIDK